MLEAYFRGNAVVRKFSNQNLLSNAADPIA
jgi:hypothetical protein